MNAATDYQRAKAVVHAASDLPASERHAFLKQAVADDPGLADEVAWMMAAVDDTAALPHGIDTPTDFTGARAAAHAPREFTVIRRLGEGGMGVVWLATRDDGGLAQPVALKFLHAAGETSPDLLERFIQERVLLGRLAHPGIARLLDGGVLSDGRPFLAMEYVEGERIDDWCAERGLGVRARVRLFLQLCSAVGFAHRHLIIHRDIKPANILVTVDGQAKLLDFGVASVLDLPHAPRDENAPLTLAYAAPEQIQKRPLTTAVDIYALGVVLYQLLAGRRPFDGDTGSSGLPSAIAAGSPPAPSLRARDPAEPRASGLRIPADVDAIVLKAMRRIPSHRYASADDLAEDLKRFLDGRPVLAKRQSMAYLTARYVRRNRWGVVALVAATLSLLGGFAASLHAWRAADAERVIAQRRQHELQRAIDFQQSVLDDVDVAAMGRAIATTAHGEPTDLARGALDRQVVSHGLASIEAAFRDDPGLGADMRRSLARTLVTIGSYEHAAAEFARVLEVRERLPDPDGRERIQAKVEFADALTLAGRPRDALAAYASVRDAAQALLPLDPLRIDFERGRARAMGDDGDPIHAAAVLDELTDRMRGHFPPTDPTWMRVRRDDIDALVNLGRRDDATRESESLMADTRGLLADDSPARLANLDTLAHLLNQRNEYERSLALAEQVANANERRLGFEHPTTLRDEDLVATNLVRLSRLDRARALIDRIIAARTAQQGADHADTLASMTTKVRLLAKADDYPGAAALQRRILAARERVLGKDHPDTLFARGSLAGFLSHAGDHRDALALSAETLDGYRHLLGPDNPMVFATLDLCARIHVAAGDLEGARALHAEALAGRDRVLGHMDAHTLESATRLYDTLRRMHRDDEALAVRHAWIDPLVALNPATLNASMRDMRDTAIDLLAGGHAGQP
ncbi:serine/threonine-protein kinase [Luteibacter sahnii]|uniref:serine/threonine-protein kinase n=1 Tax=Luteibacter sahnii TaxID=3021977 RepID=UPI002A6B7AA6|nr:protein kinase [Luteibacter sp. PPL193]MDY1547618.1 protein kinase [Luteibacter sp. PPL193]